MSNETSAFIGFVAIFFLGVLCGGLFMRSIILHDYCVNSGYDSYQVVNDIRYCLDGTELHKIDWWYDE